MPDLPPPYPLLWPEGQRRTQTRPTPAAIRAAFKDNSPDKRGTYRESLNASHPPDHVAPVLRSPQGGPDQVRRQPQCRPVCERHYGNLPPVVEDVQREAAKDCKFHAIAC